MPHFIRALLTTGLSSVLLACAGTDFKRPDPGTLEVGRSTAAQVTTIMGPAPQTGEILRNGEKLKSLRYVYAQAGGTAKYPGVVPARAQVFLLHNELLVGEEFVSSFAADATDFDESKATSIAKGKTTKSEVIALLGKPNGTGVYPFIKVKGETAFMYSYGQAKGSAFNMKFYNKTLVVSFDGAGVVTEIEYASNGEK